MSYDELLEAAKAFFEDTSRPVEHTMQGLQDLMGEVDAMLDALGENA